MSEAVKKLLDRAVKQGKIDTLESATVEIIQLQEETKNDLYI